MPEFNIAGTLTGRQAAATTAQRLATIQRLYGQFVLDPAFVARGVPNNQAKTPNEPVQKEESGMLANKFLVGCDPEFVVLDDEGRVVNLYGPLATADGPVGIDHGGAVVELRPQPAKGTYTVLKRIKEALASPKLKAVQSRKWRGGAFVSVNGEVAAEPENPNGEQGIAFRLAQNRIQNRTRERVSLGGHIHIDLSPYATKAGELKPTAQQLREVANLFPWMTQDEVRAHAMENLRAGRELGGGGYSPEHEVRVKALDHLTRRLEALDILPKSECERRRGGEHYGKFGDIRVQPNKDGSYHFEYRTMASWLFDPKVAMLCLTGAKLASLDPEGAISTLGRFHDYAPLKKWFEGYQSKDINAKRVCEKILGDTVKSVQVDPDVNFRERWESFSL